MKKARTIIPASLGLVVLLLILLPIATGGATPGVASFHVEDTSGAAMQYATVYAIPSADVDDLATQPITLESTGNYSTAAKTVDEPLEDLINGNYTPAGGGVGTYLSATTDASGNADISGLSTSDTYFIYVAPADPNTHLPGGSTVRTAVTGASLDNTTTNVEVSTKQSGAATFTGSSSCLGCHSSKSGVKQTAHKSGIMNTHIPSGLQDTSMFDADDGDWNMYAGLDNLFLAGDATSGGTNVYFYAYDSTRKFDKFKTSLTSQGAANQVIVRVYKDTADGKYKMQFTNVLNAADPNNGMIKVADLTYGGGVYKQRYLTAQDGSIYTLPLQYNSRGSEASSDRTKKVYRDYHLDWWVNTAGTATQTFKTQPGFGNAADIQCLGCHINGYTVTKDGAGRYSATGVADPNGEVNPVSGAQQELNIGCETCHGPGSEHIAAGGAGQAIVSPQNTTPEREMTICAQCHSRPQGNDSFGVKKDEPLNTSNQMLRAGISRADYLAQNTSRNDASPASDLQSDGIHAKSHHQQFTDFLRSDMYRNGSELMTCDSCHSIHAPGADRNQVTGSASNAVCLGCHTSINSSSHQVAKTGYNMGATCVQCHMVKTSSSGAGTQILTSWPHGDISSHVFDVPTRSKPVSAGGMAVPYTNQCGSCHAAQPGLNASKTSVYWGSYAEFTGGILSVDFNIGNAGPNTAYVAGLDGTVNSNGVSTNTLGAIGPVPLAKGGAAATTIKYNVPGGTAAFSSTIYAHSTNGLGGTFTYPGPYPGP